MTDKDIIKALECCADEMGCIKGCPCFDPKAKGSHCKVSKKLELEKLTIDLINRQQAEIERLKAKCENTQIGYNFAEDEIKNLKKDKYKLQKALNQSEDYRVIAKAEAIEEFAERLKAVSHPYADTQMVFELQIDNLLKEMVGEG